MFACVPICSFAFNSFCIGLAVWFGWAASWLAGDPARPLALPGLLGPGLPTWAAPVRPAGTSSCSCLPGWVVFSNQSRGDEPPCNCTERLGLATGLGSGRSKVSGPSEARPVPFLGVRRGLVPGSLCYWLSTRAGQGCGGTQVSGPSEARAVPRMRGRSHRDWSLLHILAMLVAQVLSRINLTCFMSFIF